MFNLERLEERGARWANIIASLPGCYCAFALWQQRNPGGLPLSQYPGFTFSVVTFFVLIALAAILNLLRRKPGNLKDEWAGKPPGSVIVPHWIGYESEEKWKQSLVEQGRKEADKSHREELRRVSEELNGKIATLRKELKQTQDESVSIAINGELIGGPAYHAQQRAREAEASKPLNSLFSPLQIEALTLSKDILRFIEEMGPTPTLSKEEFGGFNKEFKTFETVVRSQEYLEANSNLERPWMLKFGSTWEADFKHRVAAIVPKLGKVGIDANGIRRMNDEINSSFVKNNAAFEIAKNLMYAAQDIDTMKVVPILSEVPK